MGQAGWNDAERRPGSASPRLRRLIRVCCGTLLLARAAVAADGPAVSASPERSGAKANVNGNLAGPVRRQLTLAFRFAQERIRTSPTCSALFDRLGEDGVELLAKLRFDEVSFEKSGDSCGPGVPAHTKLGSHLVRLCPGFGVLPLPEAAVTVIHEALHSAGMTEKPADPRGLTPKELNRLVRASCSF